MNPLTDTHCHLDFSKFDADREAVIHRARQAGLVRILVPGLDQRSSREAVLLAETHPMIYAAVGFHPTDLQEFSPESFEEVRELAEHPKVRAIGEIGIDYFWVKDSRERVFQQKVLRQQLELAGSIGKPVVIHMREEGDAWTGQASKDLLDILSQWQSELAKNHHALASLPGVLHSFNGDIDTAQRALALNFFIGVTGPVTYKNADKKRGVIREVPLDRLLIETDAPFLTPAPHRGRRNEPAFVSHIADKIGTIHSISPAEVASITTQNAARLFAWGD